MLLVEIPLWPQTCRDKKGEKIIMSHVREEHVTFGLSIVK